MRVKALHTIERMVKPGKDKTATSPKQPPETETIKPGTIFVCDGADYDELKAFGAIQDAPLDDDDAEPETPEPTDRAALEARAEVLGVTVRKNTKDETLAKNIGIARQELEAEATKLDVTGPADMDDAALVEAVKAAQAPAPETPAANDDVL